MHDFFRKLDEVTRRDFVVSAARTFLGVGLASLAGGSLRADEDPEKETVAPRKKPAQNVIYLYMSGGMTHLDTFDPKPGAETQGPVKAIQTAAKGVMLSEYLPKLAKQMDKAVLFRSLSSTQGAHERGRYLMQTSYTQRGTIVHPAMGAWLLRLAGKRNDALPGNVRIGGDSQHPGGGFMEAAYAPLPIGDPASGLQNSKLPGNMTKAQFESRLTLSNDLDEQFRARFNQKKVRSYTGSYQDATQLMTSKDLEVFNIYRETEAMRLSYGDNPFGQGCLLARRLVENKVRFVEVSLGGWDTHQSNFIRVPERTEILDQALATLLSDLASRGLLEQTLVIVATEFGRTPIINQNAGRDHYPKAFSGLIAGGGIKGGRAYGKTDAKGMEVVENKLEIPDFNATIAYGLGLPLKKIITSPSKRPFTVAHKGKPVTEVF